MAKKSDKKRKRQEEDNDGTDVINAQLRAYGEKFMQMFEPTEFDNRTTAEPSSESNKDSDFDRDSLENDSSEENDDAEDDWNDAADAAVEQIFKKNKTIAQKRPIQTTKSSLAPTISSPDIEKIEKKRFMSHRAGVVSGAIPVDGGSKSSSRKKGRKVEASNGSSILENTSGKLNKEDFQKLTREVHLYGATALDKKSKKQFDAAVLEELGAKKAKAVKMPANMAIGMAKKRAKRDAAALEEAIASGMVQKKGMGKKKRAQKQKEIDRGLMEDGGAFRNGVLKVDKIGGGRGGGSGQGGSRSGGLKGGKGSRRGDQAHTMRRSARLIQIQMGGVKKHAQKVDVKASEMSNNLASTGRRRGLFQDSQAAEDTEIAHDSFVVAEHIAERPVPSSPFLLDQNPVQDLSQPPLTDENTPPPKRRHTIPDNTDAEMPAGEEMAARATSLRAASDHQGELEAAGADQSTPIEPATWLTPIRHTRPPVVDQELTPTGMPSRMPSFAYWIDGIEISEEEALPQSAVAPAAPSPPVKSSHGVDMTDLARLYDPQIAAATAKSPPTPIEKICRSLTQ